MPNISFKVFNSTFKDIIREALKYAFLLKIQI